jgi:hypothetical protein
MAQNRVGLMHRIAVDWVADTFHLRTPDARTRHAQARDRAADRAAASHHRASQRAAALPAKLHVHREPRILKGLQKRIGGRI